MSAGLRASQRHRVRFSAAVVVVAVLGIAGLGSVPAEGAVGAVDPLTPAVEQAPDVDRPAKDAALPDSGLAEAVQRLRGGVAPAGVDVRGGKALVEVVSASLDRAAVARLVAGLGGSVTGHAGPTLTEALVPAAQVAVLQGTRGVDLVRLPLEVSEPIETLVPGTTDLMAAAATGSAGSEAVTKANAGPWHGVGLTGAGVKVGIVDWFDLTVWRSAAASGDVPASPAGTFCTIGGTTCTLWTSGSAHGTAVAETVKDLAPGASLYLASVSTASDLQAAVDWFVAHGVRVVSRSLTAQYDGPGDGTGPLADVVADAASRGITWVNSAGNSAGGGGRNGSYWRGPWRDTDGDGWVEFNAAGDEVMGFVCAYVNGLRWNDWGAGAGTTDYDAYIYDDLSSTSPESWSEDTQGVGVPPLENIRASCNYAGDVDYLTIHEYASGSGTAGDVLEFMTNGGELEYWQNPYSAAAPVVDSADPAVMAVGAIDPVFGTTIAPYSSQGPTNDGRLKPNLSAASNFSSHTYPSGFNGTSAATPVVAGAAALVLQAFPGLTPAQLADYVDDAVVDRGTAGMDNVYGTGELRLAVPPPGVSRLAGGDRYATSAAISAATFPTGVDTAYVATGQAFPDALSGAPAAALGGNPVLLVTPTSVPAAIATELTRLAPSRIVILGGTGAVSASVETQLATYAGTVERISGSDRYATSAAISAATFPTGVDTAYVATGRTFPDALSGAPAAALGGNPVLLVTPTAVPAAVEAELTRLAPSRIVILGGTGAVSVAVETQLAALTKGTVVRLSGPDRYSTSAAISAATFPTGVDTAYVATGQAFPDALSGAPAAALGGNPVLLVTPTAVPTAVATELARLAPSQIVILGGTGAVSTGVATQLWAFLP